MSNKRLIALHEVSKGEATHVKVELYYSMGGMNYFTYKNEARGLKLSVTPVSRSKGEGYTTESFTAFSGIKKHVLDMKRFSQKTLDTFVVAEADLKQLIDYVLAQNGIELKKDLVESN